MSNVEASNLTVLTDPQVKYDLLFIYDKSTGVLKSIAPGDLLVAYPLPDRFDRSKFSYNGGTTAYTIKAKAASYRCKDKLCYWGDEITTDAITSPVASTRYYLYLDYSAITSGTAITSDELIWSTTAPTWSDTYRAWMNGNDRCIMGVITNSGPSNIYEFFHDGGDTVFWSAEAYSEIAGDVDSTFEDADFSGHVPGFCTRFNVDGHLDVKNPDASVTAFWKTKGQSETTGKILTMGTRIGTDQSFGFSGVPVISDSSQVIQIATSRDGDDEVTIYVSSWVFPTGM